MALVMRREGRVRGKKDIRGGRRGWERGGGKGRKGGGKGRERVKRDRKER